MEPDKDMESFVREYGTGNEIPNPPQFVNYQTTDAIPSASARPTSRPANFIRESAREIIPRQNSMPPEHVAVMNTAGVGAGGGQKRADSYASDISDSLARQPTRITVAPTVSSQQVVPHTNGNAKTALRNGPSPTASSSTPSQPAARRQSLGSSLQQQQQLQKVLQDPYAEPINPSAETFIKVGNNAYKVDLSKDPQPQVSSSSTRYNSTAPFKVDNKPGSTSASAGLGQNGTVDPLMKQLEELKNAVSSGSGRRNTVNSRTKAAPSPEPKPGHASTPPTARPTNGGSSLLPPGGTSNAASSSRNRSPSPARDYRNSAEFVVGAHPSVSRPTSPNPPTAVFMQPKASPSAPEVEAVQEVLADYQQSLPGERKSISRSNSVNRGHISNPSQASIGANHGQNLERPPSQLGHAGIGAHGSRSNSPQPISRGPSPAPNHAPAQPRGNFIQPPAQIGRNMARTPSPNTVGIALDPSGRVLHDDLAQRYHQQQQQQRSPMQAQQPVYHAPSPVQSLMQQQPQRPNSYSTPAAAPAMMSPPVVGPAYGVSPPPAMYQQSQSPQPSYIQPPPAPNVYIPPVTNQFQPPAGHIQQQPAQVSYGSVNSMNGLQRGGSMSYYGNNTPPQQLQIQPIQQIQPASQPLQHRQMLTVQTQPQQQQQQQHVRGYQQPLQQQSQQPLHQQPQQQAAYNYRGASPAQREPSPQPPAQSTDDGNNVLFYGTRLSTAT